MTDPGTLKLASPLCRSPIDQVLRVCVRMQKNKWLLFARKTFIFFRIISSSIGLDSNVTDIALNSLFTSRACALCGLRFRSFAHKDSLFALLFYFSFIYVLFVSKHTVWYEFVVQ